MLDWLGQAITYSLLQVILPLIVIAGLTALAMRLVTLATNAIDRRIIAPVRRS